MNKVIVHEIENYYQLPDGARLMNRNGMADVWEYRFIEHVYKVARVKLADGTFTNTMEHPPPVKQMNNQFSGAQSVFFENGPRISPRKSISSIYFKEFQP